MKNIFIKTVVFIWVVFIYQTACLAASTGDTLLHQYKELMKQYPAAGHVSGSCVVPDIMNNKKTKRYHTALKDALKSQPAHVNFCGRYYLFNEPISGGGDVYLSDCKTGKILALTEEYASNLPLTDAQSCLLIENPPSAEETGDHYTELAAGPPRLYQFDGAKLVHIEDTVYPKK